MPPGRVPEPQNGTADASPLTTQTPESRQIAAAPRQSFLARFTGNADDLVIRVWPVTTIAPPLQTTLDTERLRRNAAVARAAGRSRTNSTLEQRVVRALL